MRWHRSPATVLTAALAIASCGGSGIDQTVSTAPVTTAEAGIESTAPATTEGAGMELTSTAFEHATRIPSQYTCDGADISPPLTITDIPDGAATLALVVDDPDAPRGTWDHWVAYDIPLIDAIAEGAPTLGTPGFNSWERPGYGGPCPPSGSHRYFFTVYALDTTLGLDTGATKTEVLDAIAGHIVAEARLMGLYSR